MNESFFDNLSQKNWKVPFSTSKLLKKMTRFLLILTFFFFLIKKRRTKHVLHIFIFRKLKRVPETTPYYSNSSMLLK